MKPLLSKSEWDALRRKDIITAIENRLDSGQDIPAEWMVELSQLPCGVKDERLQ